MMKLEFIVTTIIGLFIILIVSAKVCYWAEPERKVLVKWAVSDGGTQRKCSKIVTMHGKDFRVVENWTSVMWAGSYKTVSIENNGAWYTFFLNTRVNIYTGLNDVEVNKLEILK